MQCLTGFFALGVLFGGLQALVLVPCSALSGAVGTHRVRTLAKDFGLFFLAAFACGVYSLWEWHGGCFPGHVGMLSLRLTVFFVYFFRFNSLGSIYLVSGLVSYFFTLRVYDIPVSTASRVPIDARSYVLGGASFFLFLILFLEWVGFSFWFAPLGWCAATVLGVGFFFFSGSCVYSPPSPRYPF